MSQPREPRSGTPAPSTRACERHDEVKDLAGQRVASGPCTDASGRPVAHTAYVAPAGGSAAVRWSMAASGVLVLVLLGLFFTAAPARPDTSGMALRRVLAPGPTSSPHAMTAMDCAQCHRPASNVESVRCERCHDPAVSARLTNAAHVFAATGDLRTALDAPEVACATCHVEHRGADVDLTVVNPRECGSCHRSSPGAWTRLTSLGRHPEFAIVHAGVETGGGLEWFNHALHIDKVQQRFGRSCDGCHEGSANAPSFQPVSFPRHCATCHEEDLSRSAGSLTPSTLAALGALDPRLRTEPDPDDPARRVIVGVRHADPWVLRAVQALRKASDPAAFAADRLMVERQIAQLELELRFGRTAPLPRAWLDPEYAGTRPGEATTPERALAELAAALDALTPALGAEAGSLAAEAKGLTPAPAPPAGEGGATASPAAIRTMLEATLARARAAEDASLEARAQALLERLEKVPAGTAAPAAPAIDGLLAELSKARPSDSRNEVRELNQLAGLVQRRAAGGMDPTAYDQHREQILQLLDSVRDSLGGAAQRGDARAAALLAREDALRRSLLATPYPVPPDEAAGLARFYQAHQADRTRVDVELESARLRIAAPREQQVMPAADARFAQLQLRLAAMATAPALEAPLPTAEAAEAIEALLGTVAFSAEANPFRKNRCTMCHELTPQGDQLAPIRTAGTPLMPGARFNHAPHVSAAADNCETCHTGIRTSALAKDVNLPPVASCLTCHAPGGRAARASGCETCHTYHAPSFAALRWRP